MEYEIVMHDRTGRRGIHPSNGSTATYCGTWRFDAANMDAALGEFARQLKQSGRGIGDYMIEIDEARDEHQSVEEQGRRTIPLRPFSIQDASDGGWDILAGGRTRAHVNGSYLEAKRVEKKLNAQAYDRAMAARVASVHRAPALPE